MPTFLGVNFGCEFFWGPEILEKQGETFADKKIAEKFAGPKLKIHPKSALQNLGLKKGGQNALCDFGGGGETYCRVPQFWRSQKVGFVWSVPVSSKENDTA